MDQPFEELARLVGKILAKRWFKRNTEQNNQPGMHSKQHADAPSDINATDGSDSSKPVSQ